MGRHPEPERPPAPEGLPLNGERARLGVLGWPVGHSRSPAMQNAALAAAGLPGWRYQLLPVPPDRLAETVRALPAAGFRGANVTIPHKAAALELADAPTDRAQAIGAANTLVFEDDGTIRADNTDGPALIDALPLRVRSALVLGAGGSARAAVWALREAGAERVAVWNRTPARARELAAALGAEPVARLAGADVLVNCTSIGLDADHDLFKQLGVAADVLTSFSCVVDFVYAATQTRLIQAARSRSIPVVDGLELLVRQGALSFAQFTGRPAPLTVMRTAAQG